LPLDQPWESPPPQAGIDGSLATERLSVVSLRQDAHRSLHGGKCWAGTLAAPLNKDDDNILFFQFALLLLSLLSLPRQIPTGLKHPPTRRSAATSVHDGGNGVVDCLEEEAATGGSGGGNNDNKNRCASGTTVAKEPRTGEGI